MSRWTINSWNAKIDKSLTVTRLGRNGILYEYILPYGANPMNYYVDAVDVKSRKRSELYQNGYRIGQYQPIGDKRYFTFYQLKQLKKSGREDEYIEMIKNILMKFYGVKD